MEPKKFICPVCGCDEYHTKSFNGLMSIALYCKGCTTLFLDSKKFTTARISKGVPLAPSEVEALLHVCGEGDAMRKLFIAFLTGVQTALPQLLETLKQVSEPKEG